MVNPKDIMEKIEKSHTYQSGLRGAVDEAGKALTTVGQAVNAVFVKAVCRGEDVHICTSCIPHVIHGSGDIVKSNSEIESKLKG
jgi:Na+-transporting NADH:ubiquinone oxidoreductase subunit NqrF